MALCDSKPNRLLCLWGFSRQEYWYGLLCPPPGDLPNPGMERRSLALQADSLPSEPPGKPIGIDNLFLFYCSVVIHSWIITESVCEHLGCFQFGSTTNKTSIDDCS